MKSQAAIKAFKEAWAKADATGQVGHRVEAGLQAAFGPFERDARSAGWERAHTTMCPDALCSKHRNPYQRTYG